MRNSWQDRWQKVMKRFGIKPDIANQIKEPNLGWILCENELPKLNTDVLVVYNNEIYMGQLGKCDEGYMWYIPDIAYGTNSLEHEVLKWMPKPRI